MNRRATLIRRQRQDINRGQPLAFRPGGLVPVVWNMSNASGGNVLRKARISTAWPTGSRNYRECRTSVAEYVVCEADHDDKMLGWMKRRCVDRVIAVVGCYNDQPNWYRLSSPPSDDRGGSNARQCGAQVPWASAAVVSVAMAHVCCRSV